MKIELKRITVRELTKGYKDSAECGVVGYGGKLDIRPAYQREFVYGVDQRDSVIVTLRKDYPLSIMYWASCSDGNFEVVDGQQRTISICQYVNRDFSVVIDKQRLGFNNLLPDQQQQILDYELMVFICNGIHSEKMAWFRTINIAGEAHTEQELRNAVYPGPWLSDAKRYFSKTGCAAYGLASGYAKGVPLRQQYLETAIQWISGGEVDRYMADHQFDSEADALWQCFQDVIAWVKATFPAYLKEMKGINWGELYDLHKDRSLDPTALEAEVATLMEDEYVSNKSGIYSYVLDGKEKHLNIRLFNQKQKREAYQRQKGICPACTKRFDIDEMEGDHITPWKLGGKTDAENCQMLCKGDNRTKSGK